jgi:hypothetical protein
MYYEEIEKYFIQKRERAASLAPIDWPMVRSWEERGIPLEVVFKGIDNAFARFQEKHSSEENTIRFLAYCQYEVENCWQTYQEMVLGKPIQELQKDKNPQAEQEKIFRYLDNLIESLTPSSTEPECQQISEPFHQTMNSLRSLRSDLEISSQPFNPPRIRNQLKKLEEDLISTIEKTLSVTQREQLSTKAERKLARYKEDMSESVYQETFRTVFRKELRELFSLPVFDLF